MIVGDVNLVRPPRKLLSFFLKKLNSLSHITNNVTKCTQPVLHYLAFFIKEPKQWRRQPDKNWIMLYFAYGSRGYLDPFSVFIGLRTTFNQTEWPIDVVLSFLNTHNLIGRCFAENRKWNAQRFITHETFLIFLAPDFPVRFAFVVCPDGRQSYFSMTLSLR